MFYFSINFKQIIMCEIRDITQDVINNIKVESGRQFIEIPFENTSIVGTAIIHDLRVFEDLKYNSSDDQPNIISGSIEITIDVELYDNLGEKIDSYLNEDILYKYIQDN